MVLESGADAGRVDTRTQQEHRCRDRSGAQYDAVGVQAIAGARDDADGAAPLQHDSFDDGVTHHGQVLPVHRGLQVRFGGRHPSVATSNERDRRGVARLGEHCGGDRPEIGHRHDGQGVATPCIGRVADDDAAVDQRRSSQPRALRVRLRGEPGTTHDQRPRRDARRPVEHRFTGRADTGAVIRAGLDQRHVVRADLTQTRRDDRPCGSTPDDEPVGHPVSRGVSFGRPARCAASL